METETQWKVKRGNFVVLTGINIIRKNNTMPFLSAELILSKIGEGESYGLKEIAYVKPLCWKYQIIFPFTR